MIAGATRLLVRLYQYTLGLVLPDSCRFQPTCSEYAIQAVEKHGARGLWLAARRILSCHPWGGCGHDPVPPATGEIRSRKQAYRRQNSRIPEWRATSAVGRTEDE